MRINWPHTKKVTWKLRLGSVYKWGQLPGSKYPCGEKAQAEV